MKLFVLNVMLAAAVAASASGTPDRAAPGSISDTLVVGLNSVDVTVSFESVENLTLINLGLTALSINPVDVLLLARLPASVSIPAEFPVQVNIIPPSIPMFGLEFEGVASVVLDTSDLDYSPGTRLRLYSASTGADFVDITEEVSAGSYRVRGSRGEFSEFLIVLDDRDPAAIVDNKFSRLSALMTAHESEIDSTLFSTLSTALASAQTSWLADDVDAAKSTIAGFQTTVSGATPAAIPNTWRSTADLVNVAGLLRATAGTLLFSLEDARDTDLDSVYDFEDNCTLVDNATQCDTDGDGYGNHCDGDLDNNGEIDSADLTALRDSMGATGAADLDCNGIVNSFDLAIMREAFGSAPGPSANLP